jgi:predicted aspartyl protease
MDIQFRDGLLFTSMRLSFRGVTKVIENMVLDTGAAKTIISPDIVEEIGVIAEPDDTISSFYGVGGNIHNSFSKKIDEVSFGGAKIKLINIDFGIIDPKGRINGLLGLDLLMEMGVIIDLKNLKLSLPT